MAMTTLFAQHVTPMLRRAPSENVRGYHGDFGRNLDFSIRIARRLPSAQFTYPVAGKEMEDA